MTSGTADALIGRCGRPGLMNTGASRHPYPYLLRDAADSGRQDVPDVSEQDEESREAYPVLLCRACSHGITTNDQRIHVAGSHRHTFFNPAGIVFELGCFGKAPGCSVLGEASDDFSWFTGYVWQVALCARCGIHLGWRFESAEMSFYGLVLANLESGEK